MTDLSLKPSSGHCTQRFSLSISHPMSISEHCRTKYHQFKWLAEAHIRHTQFQNVQLKIMAMCAIEMEYQIVKDQ